MEEQHATSWRMGDFGKRRCGRVLSSDKGSAERLSWRWPDRRGERQYSYKTRKSNPRLRSYRAWKCARGPCLVQPSGRQAVGLPEPPASIERLLLKVGLPDFIGRPGPADAEVYDFEWRIHAVQFAFMCCSSSHVPFRPSWSTPSVQLRLNQRKCRFDIVRDLRLPGFDVPHFHSPPELIAAIPDLTPKP
jgi:hypothetical protein